MGTHQPPKLGLKSSSWKATKPNNCEQPNKVSIIFINKLLIVLGSSEQSTVGYTISIITTASECFISTLCIYDVPVLNQIRLACTE